jgi:predicted transcriptional regulator
MEATFSEPRKMVISLRPDTYQSLTSVAEAQHSTIEHFIETALNEMAEDIEDAAIYRYLSENVPEGKEMLSEDEKMEFENKYGLI